MSLWRALWVAWSNIRRNKRSFVLASVGLVVGVMTGTFFVALGAGVQAEVLNRIYPVNQIEVEPRTVAVMGVREQVVDADRLGEPMVEAFRALPDVTRVYPKLRSKLQARLWGGKALFGYDARTEAFFDGLEPDLLAEELQETEGVEAKRARDAVRRRRPRCRRDDECPLGQECGADGVCATVEYWRRFRDAGIAVPCTQEGSGAFCPPGEVCAGGVCARTCGDDGATCGAGSACVPAQADVCQGGSCAQVCAPTCHEDTDCADGFACTGPAPQGAPDGGTGTCQRLRCHMRSARAQLSERPQDWRGQVDGVCANGVEATSPACEPMACPGRSYCAPTSVKRADGFCEEPIPVLLSPFLIEVFNSSVAESLGLRRLDGTDALLGVQFRVQLGDSYFTSDLPADVQSVKRAEIVGFSDKALDFGFTMPIGYVRAINARYKGRAAAETYSTFILETQGNEDVTGLIAAAKERGFTLARKSQDARKAADLLFILTAVFAFISVVIAGVAAVNIANTFLMIITERRYEIGIMRAVGASQRDIRRLVLLEASALGLFGGVVGELLSYGASRLVNAIAAEHFQTAMFKPDNFFVYDPWILVGGLAIAWLFCLLGAFAPAYRAAKLDPAVVLTS